MNEKYKELIEMRPRYERENTLTPNIEKFVEKKINQKYLELLSPRSKRTVNISKNKHKTDV